MGVFDGTVFEAMVAAQQHRRDIFVHDGSARILFTYKVGNASLPLEYPADAKRTILKDMFSLIGVESSIELEYEEPSNASNKDLKMLDLLMDESEEETLSERISEMKSMLQQNIERVATRISGYK